MNNHITDPLAYLYEEMTPDQMEQARQHLAVCPECKKQTAAILETVKTYRRAPRPAVPAGLADRAASAALRQASRPEPVEAGKEPAAAQQEAVVLEMPGKPDQDELEYINQSMPARLGWREWFFHPAWTVAAGVIFVCAILIHLSPRQNHWFTQSPVEYYPIETRTVSTSMAEPPARRLSDRLPAPLERHQSQAVAPEPQPPAVAVAEAYGIPSVSASPVSPPVEATVQASAIVASPPAAIPEPVPASSAPALSAPAPAVQAPRQAPTRTRTVEDAPLVQQRRPASREADRIGTESADSVGAVDHAGPAPKQPTSVASLFAGAARRPSSAGAAGQDEKVSAGSSFSAPPQPMPTEKTVVVEPLPVPAAAVAGGEPEAELARADVVATDAGDAEPAPPSAGSFDSNSAPPFAASQSAEYAISPTPDFADRAAAAIVPGSEVWTREAADAAQPAESELMLLESTPPPILIQRPEPVDIARTVEELVFLIGLQLGERAYSEATQTIDILRKVDEKKADELLARLLEMEKADAENPPASESMADEQDLTEQAAETETSENAPNHPAPATEPAPPARPVTDPLEQADSLNKLITTESPANSGAYDDLTDAIIQAVPGEPEPAVEQQMLLIEPVLQPQQQPSALQVPPLPPMPVRQPRPSLFLDDAPRISVPPRRRNPFSSDPYVRGD